MFQHIRLISLVFILFPGTLFSQEKWTLDRCISHAYENNIQLKQTELGVKLAENNLLQSKLELLPDVGAGASQTFRFGRSVDPLTYEFTTKNSKGSSFYGSTQIDLFSGFSEINTVKRDKLKLGIILADFETAKNDLSLNITRLYLQILFKKELLDIARQQMDISSLQVKTTQKLVDAGSLPKGDLLEIKAQLASEELKQVDAENQLKSSLIVLAQLLDIKDIESFDIIEPGFENIMIRDVFGTSNEVFDSAILLMPRVKSAELMVKYSERDLAVTRGMLSPSVSMRASWGSGYSDRILDFESNNIMPFLTQLDYASSTSLSFNLQVPIFNNFAYRTEIKNSLIELQNSNYQLEFIKSQLRKEIQQSLADAKAAFEKYRASDKALALLNEAFQYTDNKYGQGLITSLEYNIAKNNLTKAQSELIQAKYSYIFNTKILDFYRGIPVELK